MLEVRNGQKDPENLMGLEEVAKINNKSLQGIILRVKRDQNLTEKVLNLSIKDLQKNKRCKKKKQKSSKERNFNLNRIKYIRKKMIRHHQNKDQIQRKKMIKNHKVKKKKEIQNKNRKIKANKRVKIKVQREEEEDPQRANLKPQNLKIKNNPHLRRKIKIMK